MNYQIKDIQGFPGYQIDTNSDVWSNLPMNNEKSGVIKPRKKTVSFCKGNNYGRVYFRIGNRKTCARLIHRLVAMAFIPNPMNLPCVCHIDGNPKNNKIENLRWDTHKGNSEEMVAHGTSPKGERHGRHVLTTTDVKQIKGILKQGDMGVMAICRLFNVSQGCIEGIKSGQNWKHVII